MNQSVVACPRTIYSYDKVNIDFMSSALPAQLNEYNISDYYGFVEVSLGLANEARITNK